MAGASDALPPFDTGPLVPKFLHSPGSLPVLVFLGVIAARSPAVEIVDIEAGYTLSLPEGWERISDDALKQVSDALGGGSSDSPNFVAAFGPAGRDSDFQYPYALVQVHNYGAGINLATISRHELEGMVANLTGVPMNELTNGLSDKATELVLNATLDSPRVILTPPGFVMESKVDYEEAGVIRGSTLGIVGRTNTVFLHFYGKEAEWSQCREPLEQLASGFHRTQDQRVVIGEVTRTTTGKQLGGGLDWGRMGEKALVGLVLGAIVGAIGMATSRRNQARQN